MKKLVLALSFVFVLGLISVSAQDKKVVKKDTVKTEQTTKKVVKKPAGKKEVKTTKTTKTVTTPEKK